MSRQDKIAEAIRQEVSVIIHDKLKDPRIGFITIVRVELTRDLRLAKVYYSILGKDEDRKKTKAALDSALGYIKSKVAQRLNLRLATDLIFKEDRSIEYSVKIEELLKQVKELEKTHLPESKPPKEG